MPASAEPPTSLAFPNSRSRGPVAMQARDPRVDDGYDEDLKKALEMSLEEVRGYTNTGYVPQSQLPSHCTPSATNGPPKKQTVRFQEADDPELKAAIAASLADMEDQKRKHAVGLKQQATDANNKARVTPIKSNHELSLVEAENINLFATLVDRLQSQPPGTILREPQIQELYDSIGTLRPKLARTYGETMSKHGRSIFCPAPSSLSTPCMLILPPDALLDLHAKLSTVVRYYDRMLEERLSSTYSHHTIDPYPRGQPARGPSSNLYPVLSSRATNGSGDAEGFYTGRAHSISMDPGRTAGHNWPSKTGQVPPQSSLALPEGPAGPAAGRSRHPFSEQPSQLANGYPSQYAASPQAYSTLPQSRPEFVPPEAHWAGHAPAQMSRLPPQHTPASDQDASYYYNTSQPLQPQSSASPQQVPRSDMGQASQAPSYPRFSQPPPLSHGPPQHSGQTYSIPLPSQTAPPPDSQYPQQNALSQIPVALSGTMYANASGYSDENFPSPPQHQPQPKVVEESLIDL